MKKRWLYLMILLIVLLCAPALADDLAGECKIYQAEKGRLDTIAKEAFDMHMTQHESGHWRVPGPDQPYDSTRYTLVFSTVGEDTQGNDMLENIAPETLSNYHP